MKVFKYFQYREQQEESTFTNIPMFSALCWVALTVTCAVFRTELQDHSTDIFPGSYGLEIPFALCLIELLVCVATLDIQLCNAKGFFSEGIVIWILAQLGGSFLENFWFSLHEMPRLVYSVGYFDPFITLPIAKFCLDFTPTLITFTGLATLTFGAICFSSDITNFSSIDRSGVIIGCFVAFYAIRNMCSKSLQDEGLKVELRVRTLVTFVTIAILTVLLSGIMSFWQLSAVLLHGAIVTVLVSLTMYLSLKIIETSGIIFLTILSVWSKIFVNLLCVTHFDAPHAFVSFIAVGLMFLGTLIYLRQSHAGNSKKFNLNEAFTRMEFLIFVGGIVAILFYVLQPSLSERDLHALSYVRLDGIMRKLLQHDSNTSY